MRLIFCPAWLISVTPTLEAQRQAASGVRGTEKAKVFVALSLDEHGNPQYLKMRVAKNIKRISVKKFAHAAVAKGSPIRSDGY